MHYDYSVMKEKTCWHYGEHTVSDEYFICYMDYSDTIRWKINKEQYDTTEIGDLLVKYYTYLYQDNVLIDSSLTIK
jgi:hypothetical protein